MDNDFEVHPVGTVAALQAEITAGQNVANLLVKGVKDLEAEIEQLKNPEFLIEMSNQMRTQDNHGSAHPFFQVRHKKYIVTEQGYNDHHFELCDEEGTFYKSDSDEPCDIFDYFSDNYSEWLKQWGDDQGFLSFEEHEFSDIFDLDNDHFPEGVSKVYVQEVEEIVSTHFTLTEALRFIDRKQHDYPKLYTYAASAYWSPQWRELQDWIISLTQPPTA